MTEDEMNRTVAELLAKKKSGELKGTHYRTPDGKMVPLPSIPDYKKDTQ